jgi:hypothetical protein
MLANAFLAVVTGTERAEPNPARHRRRPLIALTCNEIHRLFNAFIAEPICGLHHLLRWSMWRCRHQLRARASHHHRRQALAA